MNGHHHQSEESAAAMNHYSEPLEMLTELSYFAQEKYQDSVQLEYERDFQPQAQPAPNTAIEFYIESASGVFLDVNDITLEMRFRAVHRDGTALGADDQCSFANMPMHTIWRSVELYYNGTLVTDANALYAYRAYFEVLTNYGEDAMKTRLLTAGWVKDTSLRFDQNHCDDAGTNLGLVERAKPFRQSRYVTLVDKLHLDAFHQMLLLIPGVSIRLRLIPNSPEFFLIAPPTRHAADRVPALPVPDYRLEISNATLRVPSKEVNPALLAALHKMMQVARVPLALPIKRVSMKHFTIPTGQNSFVYDNAYGQTLPHRIVMALVADGDMSGNYTTNPFNLRNYDVSYLSLVVNGEMIPRQPLQPNFTAGQENYTREYYHMCKTVGDLAGGPIINLTPVEWGNGYTFWAFKISPGPINIPGLKAIAKKGTLRLEMRFRTPLPHNVNVILYAEYDAYIRIDPAYNVIVE